MSFRSRIVSVLVFIAVAGAMTLAGCQKTDPLIQAQVEAAVNRYITAISEGDLDSAMEFYADKVQLNVEYRDSMTTRTTTTKTYSSTGTLLGTTSSSSSSPTECYSAEVDLDKLRDIIEVEIDWAKPKRPLKTTLINVTSASPDRVYVRVVREGLKESEDAAVTPRLTMEYELRMIGDAWKVTSLRYPAGTTWFLGKEVPTRLGIYVPW